METGGFSLEVRELLWASLSQLHSALPNPGTKELCKINGEISGALEHYLDWLLKTSLHRTSQVTLSPSHLPS